MYDLFGLFSEILFCIYTFLVKKKKILVNIPYNVLIIIISCSINIITLIYL